MRLHQTGEDHFRETADGTGMQYQGFRSYARDTQLPGNVDNYNT